MACRLMPSLTIVDADGDGNVNDTAVAIDADGQGGDYEVVANLSSYSSTDVDGLVAGGNIDAGSGL